METIRIKDLPDKPKCPRCGSYALGLLKVDEEKAMPLIEKKDHLAKDEEKMQLQAKRTGELIEKYGKAAAVALSARRVQTVDFAAVLEKEPEVSDRFYELVMEAERKALNKRF
jgi:ATP-dependent Lhr-like helicase